MKMIGKTKSGAFVTGEVAEKDGKKFISSDLSLEVKIGTGNENETVLALGPFVEVIPESVHPAVMDMFEEETDAERLACYEATGLEPEEIDDLSELFEKHGYDIRDTDAIERQMKRMRFHQARNEKLEAEVERLKEEIRVMKATAAKAEDRKDTHCDENDDIARIMSECDDDRLDPEIERLLERMLSLDCATTGADWREKQHSNLGIVCGFGVI